VTGSQEHFCVVLTQQLRNSDRRAFPLRENEVTLENWQFLIILLIIFPGN